MERDLLVPTPPPSQRGPDGIPIPRPVPPTVRIRAPEPVSMDIRCARLMDKESAERSALMLVEDNASMVIFLEQWQQHISIDPNVQWAEEGSRDVIVRHEDRDWSMMGKAIVANRALAQKRYKDRILAGSLALERAFLEGIPPIEEEEKGQLAEILRWEKVHRPWMMPSPTSAKRRQTRNSTAMAEPTKPNAQSFAFRGRQMWAKEKQLQYERRKHQGRFAQLEDDEELARGSVEAAETKIFMAVEQQQLEERFETHKRYLQRKKDIEEGVSTEHLSEASLHRQRTDAAKSIQRTARSYVARRSRKQRAAAVDKELQMLDKREEASRQIQRFTRASLSRSAIAGKRTQLEAYLAERDATEPFDATEEIEEETASPPAATSSPTRKEEDSSGEQPVEGGTATEGDDHKQESGSPSTPKQQQQQEEAVEKSAPRRLLFPWEVPGAAEGHHGLNALAHALQQRQQIDTMVALKPLFASLNYKFDVYEELPLSKDQGREEHDVVHPTYNVLDLVCSTVDEDDIEGKMALYILVDGIYHGNQAATIASDGTYPSLEQLIAQGRDHFGAIPVPFQPSRVITKEWLHEHWETSTHHNTVNNAVELTPTRWSNYEGKQELESEEVLELGNNEMLCRERDLVMPQIQEMHGIASLFYHSSPDF